MPAAGVSEREGAAGRDGELPPTIGVPLIGVSVREDGGGGRVDGVPVAGVTERGVLLAGVTERGVPLAGVTERGTTLEREGSVLAVGAPLAGVSLRDGGVLGCTLVVGAALLCTASMPPAGVSERGGMELGRFPAAGTALARTAGMPLAGVSERCGMELGRAAEAGTTLERTGCAFLSAAVVVAALPATMVGTTAAGSGLVGTFATLATRAGSTLATRAGSTLADSALCGGTNAETGGAASATDSSAPQSSSISSVFGMSDWNDEGPGALTGASAASTAAEFCSLIGALTAAEVDDCSAESLRLLALGFLVFLLIALRRPHPNPRGGGIATPEPLSCTTSRVLAAEFAECDPTDTGASVETIPHRFHPRGAARFSGFGVSAVVRRLVRRVTG